jgi:hypothetical protein
VHAYIKTKSDSQNKMRMPYQNNKKGHIKEKWQKKKRLKDTMSQENDNDPESLKP